MRAPIGQALLALLSFTFAADVPAAPSAEKDNAAKCNEQKCYCLPSALEIPDYATCDWCCSDVCGPKIAMVGAKDVSTVMCLGLKAVATDV